MVEVGAAKLAARFFRDFSEAFESAVVRHAHWLQKPRALDLSSLVLSARSAAVALVDSKLAARYVPGHALAAVVIASLSAFRGS